MGGSPSPPPTRENPEYRDYFGKFKVLFSWGSRGLLFLKTELTFLDSWGSRGLLFLKTELKFLDHIAASNQIT